ncbi:hypothetical protein H0H81_011498 [Sphagnurus paluster]|uniref:Uncharacterized protein n=1 Tax=Sphagnurus paluster TaxID=117069 RepID=A0A9P7K6A1_9AGAR|nr:hypothetical protein H0H81_011498 [Sphagnurus paluster]
MSSIQVNDCTFKTSTQSDDEYPRVLGNITIKAIHAGHTVATLSAIKILRQFCRGYFLEVMDAHSPAFCRSVWQQRTSASMAAYVSVKEPYRNTGLGSGILAKLIESNHVQDSDLLMCWPSPVGVTDKTESANTKQKQINFVRKVSPVTAQCGASHIPFSFRRVGRTNFFGCSSNPAHASRAIPIDADADEQSESFDTSADEDLSAEDIASKYPLHFAIVNQSGQEAVDTIKAHHQADASSIHKLDASEFTPIHVALGKANPHAVRTLLDLGVAADLQNSQNAAGTTPLEGLAESKRSTREFTETMLGWWATRMMSLRASLWRSERWGCLR